MLTSPDGTFGARGASIKVGIVGLGMVAGELVLRRRPKLQPYIGAVDFVVAGVEGGVAAHDLGYPQASTK